MESKFILYKIWYGSIVAYIGQTIQSVQNRMKQHYYYDKDLDFRATTKIEYAYVNSQADLNVYELYYINKYNSFENRIGLAKDKLTITLPELEWIELDPKTWTNDKKSDTIGIRKRDRRLNIDERYL